MYLTPQEKGDMNWKGLFFIDWRPDVILALSVCFHAATEVRSDLATTLAAERMVKKKEKRRRRKKKSQVWRQTK